MSAVPDRMLYWTTAEKIEYLLRKGENRAMNTTTASDQPDPLGRVGVRVRYRALSLLARVILAAATTVRVVAGGVGGGVARVVVGKPQTAPTRYPLHPP